jgi:hypothetical protein
MAFMRVIIGDKKIINIMVASYMLLLILLFQVDFFYCLIKILNLIILINLVGLPNKMHTYSNACWDHNICNQ